MGQNVTQISFLNLAISCPQLSIMESAPEFPSLLPITAKCLFLYIDIDILMTITSVFFKL